MRKTMVALILLSLALAGAGPSSAMNLFERAKSVFRGPDVEGVVLTDPRRLSGDTLESEVWVFSTTLGRALYLVRFESGALAKVTKTVFPGSRLRVTRSYAVVQDGMQVIVASDWKSRKPKDDTQAEFVATYRNQILAYGLRFSPDLLAKAFSGENKLVLQQLSDDLAQLQKVIAPIIEPVGIQEHDIPMAGSPPSDH